MDRQRRDQSRILCQKENIKGTVNLKAFLFSLSAHLKSNECCTATGQDFTFGKVFLQITVDIMYAHAGLA